MSFFQGAEYLLYLHRSVKSDIFSLIIPTVEPEHQWCLRPFNAAFGDRVGHHTCVVAHIRWYHLGDVEVARLLRHKAPRVLGDKRWVLVEDPREGEFCPNT